MRLEDLLTLLNHWLLSHLLLSHLLLGVLLLRRRNRRVLLALLHSTHALHDGQNRRFVDNRFFGLNDLLLILDWCLLVLHWAGDNLLVVGHRTRRIDRNARGFVIHRGHSTSCCVACAGCGRHVVSIPVH